MLIDKNILEFVISKELKDRASLYSLSQYNRAHGSSILASTCDNNNQEKLRPLFYTCTSYATAYELNYSKTPLNAGDAFQ